VECIIQIDAFHLTAIDELLTQSLYRTITTAWPLSSQWNAQKKMRTGRISVSLPTSMAWPIFPTRPIVASSAYVPIRWSCLKYDGRKAGCERPYAEVRSSYHANQGIDQGTSCSAWAASPPTRYSVRWSPGREYRGWTNCADASKKTSAPN